MKSKFFPKRAELRFFLRNKNFLSLLFLLLLTFSVSAQNTSEISKKQLKEYRKNPLWIGMMEDSTVNYFQAKAAFEEFWRGKEKPEEEGFDFKEKQEKKSLIKRIFENNDDAKKYAFEHKKFENWLRTKQAYLKPDGTLMSEDEFQAQVQEELRRRIQDAKKLNNQ